MIDHVVYATADLDEAVARLTELFGVAPHAGGAHPDRGTRNALVNLGGQTYLEVIGPDPDQPDPVMARAFGIDEIIEGLAPEGIAGWCARSLHPLDVTHRRLCAVGLDYGPVESMSRDRPDGARLAWNLMVPDLGELRGGIPFFIDWGTTAHPTSTMTDDGVTLQRLTVPDHGHHVALTHETGNEPRLDDQAPIAKPTILLDTPNGPVEL